MDLATNSTLLNSLLFIVGIAILVKGSDFFVESAAALAKKLGVSDVIIGLTLVSIGTSLPELAANICASIVGSSSIALGNIVGSNFTNVALILGISCLLMGFIEVPKAMYKRDIWIMLLGSISLSILLFVFGKVNYIVGIIYLLICVGYIALLIKSDKAAILEEENIEVPQKMWVILTLFPIGLLMIFAGSKLVVDNTIWASVKLGMNQSVIASTVVALGTSLPELAVTISGIIKKKNGIALGNIIGSNIFNIFLVIGISSCISTISLDKTMMMNLIFLLVSDFALMGFLVFQKRLLRVHGIIFLLIYTTFVICNLYSIK